MTIEYIKNGDLFESGCEGLVCPVNTKGKMGKELALEFRNRYPAYFKDYQWRCEVGDLKPGGVCCYFHSFFKHKGPTLIFSLATKDHWYNPSKLEWVESGCLSLVKLLNNQYRDIKSIAIPALGAGLGGLDWQQVKPLMEQAFSQCPDILFKIYEPLETTGQ
jgi:O-acetyl-ADP-ribose deacetylase (regulator of RNase III)